jgi:curved DNA-binding protein CbpA
VRTSAGRPRERDYYALLGVSPAATADEIRRAYRRLALAWHPDRNPGNPDATERFKELSVAYAVLIDPARRADYDRARRAGVRYESGRSPEDLFRDLFADPGASAVFDDLARELERLGFVVSGHRFRQTLLGGRAVVTGGVFVVNPLAPFLALLRLRPAAPRGARAAAPPAAGPVAALRGLAHWLGRAGERPAAGPGLLGRLAALLGGAARRRLPDTGPGERDLLIPLRLTPAEAARGGRRRVAIPRDGAQQELLVTVPPGVRPGTRLRLRGQGRRRAGMPPGDAYLAIEVAEG